MTDVTKILNQIEQGDPGGSEKLLPLVYDELRRLAAGHMAREKALANRADASDLVQETFLDAHRDLAGFEGSTEPEWLGWLRKILNRNVVDQIRHHGAQRRDWRRDGSLEAMVERSSAAIHEALGREVRATKKRARIQLTGSV